MKDTVGYSLLKREDFYEGTDSLYRFLDYCASSVPEDENDTIDIFLVQTDTYYLIEVKVPNYDDSLRDLDAVQKQLVMNSPTHPYLLLASELCRLEDFVQLQSTSSEDSYGVSIEPNNDNTEVEFFNQNFGQGKEETLYTISFNDGISYAWKTIRKFTRDYENVRYYINNKNDETKRVI
jgi:hypothetical protein